ncbi:hypothetical protein FB45DRAFT_1001734 [Roridomyces roridus]|uniref:Uncharacterized protein n=1 Tax=Roridomyces roridus TaxID=1738132 RepID=A0AAD7C200_9AGAR|nr:hypothetical protein FB45DRAFT_1001734 [Roridomyces roridus]
MSNDTLDTEAETCTYAGTSADKERGARSKPAGYPPIKLELAVLYGNPRQGSSAYKPDLEGVIRVARRTVTDGEEKLTRYGTPTGPTCTFTLMMSPSNTKPVVPAAEISDEKAAPTLEMDVPVLTKSIASQERTKGHSRMSDEGASEPRRTCEAKGSPEKSASSQRAGRWLIWKVGIGFSAPRSTAMATRKQVTYSKRHRPKTRSTNTASPPSVNELEDPDQYLSHSELSRRLLKRARDSSNSDSPSISKRLKVAASSQSSRPDTSPSRRPKPGTSSRNLKENESSRGPARDDQYPKSSASSHLLRQSPAKRGLSQTRAHPNVSALHDRLLPSAAEHPPFSSQNSQSPSDRFSSNFQTAFTNKRPSYGSQIAGIPFSVLPGDGLDFDHQFFVDAQGSSTPAPPRNRKRKRAARAEPLPPPLIPSLSVSLSPIPIVPRGMKALSTRERSPWLSDSIISPPGSDEWERIPEEFGLDGNSASRNPDFEVMIQTDADDTSSFGPGLTPGLPSFMFAGRSRGEDEDETITEDLMSRTDGVATNKKHIPISAADKPTPEPVIPLAADPSAVPATTTAPTRLKLKPKPLNAKAKVISKPSRVVPIVLLPKLKRTRNPPRRGSTPDELDVLDLTAIPVLQQQDKGKMSAITEEEEGDSEDELLLKPGFNVWE